MLESAGVPLPGETILVSASIYASTLRGLDIRFVIAAAAAGAIVGDNIGFWVGRTFGQRLLTRRGYLIGLDERKLKLGQYLFMRHGGKIVFFGRFVALLRTLAAILAGVNRFSPLRFFVLNWAAILSAKVSIALPGPLAGPPWRWRLRQPSFSGASSKAMKSSSWRTRQRQRPTLRSKGHSRLWNA
jgi:membrane protein DedA with SNARE-associated domain